MLAAEGGYEGVPRSQSGAGGLPRPSEPDGGNAGYPSGATGQNLNTSYGGTGGTTSGYRSGSGGTGGAAGGVLVPVVAVMEDSLVLEVAVAVLMVMAALVDLDTTAAVAAVVDGTKTLMRVVTLAVVAAVDLPTLVVSQVLHQTQTVPQKLL